MERCAYLNVRLVLNQRLIASRLTSFLRELEIGPDPDFTLKSAAD